MRFLLLGIVCTSLVAALSPRHNATLICGTPGGLSKPSCVTHGSYVAPNYKTCWESCVLYPRCESYSYDTPSKTCRLYTQTLLQQGFRPIDTSSARYWQRHCPGEHHPKPHPSPSKSGTILTSTSSTTSPSSTPTYDTCEFETVYYDHFRRVQNEGLSPYHPTTTGCDPNALTIIDKDTFPTMLMSFPRGQAVEWTISQPNRGCNGLHEYIYLAWLLKEGNGEGCVMNATVVPTSHYYSTALTAGSSNYSEVYWSPDADRWGPGPDHSYTYFNWSLTVRCDGTKQTKVVVDDPILAALLG